MSEWTSIPVETALDLLQFWVDSDWPMTERAAADRATEIGWTKDEEGWVSNDLFGLSFPDIEGIGPADDPVTTIVITLTDHQKEMTDDFTRFVADRFAEYVDAAQKRWGTADLRRSDADRAYFDLGRKGGVVLVRSKVVEGLYLTQAEVTQRKANSEWAG